MRLTNDTYEYINLSYLLEIAEGDEDFLEHMLDAYLTSIPENVDKLMTAAGEGDCKRVLFCAHTLKGSFNFIGSTVIAGQLGALECECRNGQPGADVVALVKPIAALAEKATAEVSRILKKLRDE